MWIISKRREDANILSNWANKRDDFIGFSRWESLTCSEFFVIKVFVKYDPNYRYLIAKLMKYLWLDYKVDIG